MQNNRLIAGLVALMLLLTAGPLWAAAPLRIFIDGQELALPPDQQPVIQSGRTLVPMRAIFEALGAQLRWDAATKTVTGTRGPRVVVLQIGSPSATVDGRDVPLDQPAELIANRTYVPLRFVSEALGARVGWDPATRTISITTDSQAGPAPTPPPAPGPSPAPAPGPAPPPAPAPAPSPSERPLTGAPLPHRTYESSTFQVGDLSIAVRQEPAFTWPMETPKLHMVATNIGTGTLTVPYRATVRETNQEVSTYPQPPILYLAPGESQAMAVILDAEGGRINTLPFDQVSRRTVVWSFAGQGELETTVSVLRVDAVPRPGQPLATPTASMKVSGRVVDPQGQAIPDVQIEARAGGIGVPTGTSHSGSFELTLQRASNWVITAARPGYATSYTFLDEAKDYSGLVVVLDPHPNKGFTYQTAQVLERSSIGFWQGRVTPDGGLVLLPQGMEIWSREVEPDRNSANLMLYTTAGEKRWQHAMGYEAWGADISADGKWAVYAAKDPFKPELGLVDAATGRLVWEKPLDTTAFPSGSTFTGHQSNEVRFSPDGTMIGVGTGEGDVYLIQRSDGAVVWSAFLEGQVRGVTFSPDGQYMYAGAGNGVLAKLRVADGTEVWRAPIGTWPLLDGMKLSPDGTKIGTMSKAGEATVVDTATGRVLFTYDTAGIGQWADFSGDSRVFVAASFGGTYGFVADSGERLFRLDGGKAGRFAKGQNFLVMNFGGTTAVYDYRGTRISNRIPGLDGPVMPGQFAWVSADGRTVMLAASLIQQPGSPVLWIARGETSAVPVDSTMGPGAPPPAGGP